MSLVQDQNQMLRSATRGKTVRSQTSPASVLPCALLYLILNKKKIKFIFKVPLLWVMKGSYFGFGTPNNRLTCMQGQKHFHFLIICIYFYLICSMTPKRFVQRLIFPNPSCVTLLCADWSISFKAVFVSF